jgi:enoyl-CoA hydratase
MLADVEDGVGLITFNQPKKRNAVSVAMWEGLASILDAFEADDHVRTVVLTGAGSHAFVAGADVDEFDAQRADADAQREYDRLTSACRARLAGFAKPTIARIRGYCLGEGLGIAIQCDLRIGGIDAEFGIPAARLGMAYGFDFVARLVGLVGPAHARALLYTAGRIDAAEAQRIGLINRALEIDELSDAVVDLARTIADNAPLSVKAMNLMVNEAEKDARQRDIAAIDTAIAACFDSADYIEGRNAFLEKRPPKFKGL